MYTAVFMSDQEDPMVEGAPAATEATNSQKRDSTPPPAHAAVTPCQYEACKKQMLFSTVNGETEAYSYKEALPRIIFYHILGVLTCGLLYIIMYWRTDWRLLLCCRQSILEEATHLLVKVRLQKLYKLIDSKV